MIVSTALVVFGLLAVLVAMVIDPILVLAVAGGSLAYLGLFREVRPERKREPVE